MGGQEWDKDRPCRHRYSPLVADDIDVVATSLSPVPCAVSVSFQFMDIPPYRKVGVAEPRMSYVRNLGPLANL